MAHILSDYTVDPNFTPNPNGIVETLAYTGSSLYVGGRFTSIDNHPSIQYLAKLDGSSGTVDASFSPNPDSFVETIQASGSDLLVGGRFTTIASQNRNRLAKVNLASGLVDGSFAPNFNNRVEVVRVINNHVLVGGLFTSVDNQSQQYVARLDLIDGSLDGNFSPTPNFSVSDIIPSGADIFLAGDFSNISGHPTFHLAKVSVIDGSVDTNFSQTDSNIFINSLSTDGTSLYSVGFVVSGGLSQFRHGLLGSVDLINGNIDRDEYYANAEINSILIESGDILLGGEFKSLNTFLSPYLAKVESSSGAVDPNFVFNPDNAVTSLLIEGNGLFVGGDYLQIDGLTQHFHLCKVDLVGQEIVTTFLPDVPPVRTMVTSGNSLYVPDGAQLSKINLNTGQEDSGFDLTIVPSSVAALATYSNNLFIGGAYTTIDGQSINALAKADLINGDLDPAFANNLPGGTSIRSIESIDNDLFIGGNISYNGGTINNLLKVNAVTGTVDGNLTPNPNSAVFHLLSLGDGPYRWRELYKYWRSSFWN